MLSTDTTVAAVPTSAPAVSKARQRAAWILLPVGVLLMLAGACLSAVFVTMGGLLTEPAAGGPGRRTAMVAFGIGLFAVLEVTGTLFLICRSRILRGGRTAAVVALSAAAAQIAVMLVVSGARFVQLFQSIRQGKAGANANENLDLTIGLITSFAVVMVLGLLIYYLVRVLREMPRPVADQGERQGAARRL